MTVRQESTLDALLVQHQAVHRPPAYYTSDWQAARRSVETLAGLKPEVAATGYGRPMSGRLLREQSESSVRNWKWAAVPAQERYVDRPALADERGVVSVPPPVFDSQLATAAGIGVIAIAGLLFLRAHSAASGHRART